MESLGLQQRKNVSVAQMINKLKYGRYRKHPTSIPSVVGGVLRL